MTRKWLPIVMTIGCLAASGCGANGQDAGTPEPGPAAGKAKNTGAGCPEGRYRVTRITPGPGAGAGDLDVRLTGGTSMTIEFTGGKWTLSDDGSRPLKATVSAPGAGSLSGKATVRGELHGSYARAGGTVGFKQGGGSGSVVVSSPAGSDKQSISAVGPALVPDGTATVRCTGAKATIKSENMTMTLNRVGGGSGGAGAAGTDSSGGSGGSGGSNADELVLGGKLQVHNVHCKGRAILVEGETNTVNLQGACPKVRIAGSKNTVNIQRADSVTLTGKLNTVNVQRSVSGGRPKIDDQGTLNRVNAR